MSTSGGLWWFPTDPQEILNRLEVMALSPEELGCLLRLRCYQWLNGTLPDNEHTLSKLSGAGERWPAVRDNVLTLFEKIDGGYLDPELEAVRQDQQRKHERLSEAGKQGARGRWGSHSQANGQAMAPPQPGQNACYGIREDERREDEMRGAGVDANDDLMTLAEVNDFIASKREPVTARELVAQYALCYERAYGIPYRPEVRDVGLMQTFLGQGFDPATVAGRMPALFSRDGDGKTWWEHNAGSKQARRRPDVQAFSWAFSRIGDAEGETSQYRDAEV